MAKPSLDIHVQIAIDLNTLPIEEATLKFELLKQFVNELQPTVRPLSIDVDTPIRRRESRD